MKFIFANHAASANPFFLSHAGVHMSIFLAILAFYGFCQFRIQIHDMILYLSLRTRRNKYNQNKLYFLFITKGEVPREHGT